MDCEMCGRKQATVRAAVEGSVLALCEGCSRFGKVAGRIAAAGAEAKKKKAGMDSAAAAEEDSELTVANLGQLIKHKREQLGMKQEEFAKKIAVKESALHRMETGAMKPDIEEAHRIGRLLGLRLVEKPEAVEEVAPKPRRDQLTLGDMIKVRKK